MDLEVAKQRFGKIEAKYFRVKHKQMHEKEKEKTRFIRQFICGIEDFVMSILKNSFLSVHFLKVYVCLCCWSLLSLPLYALCSICCQKAVETVHFVTCGIKKNVCSKSTDK